MLQNLSLVLFFKRNLYSVQVAETLAFSRTFVWTEQSIKKGQKFQAEPHLLISPHSQRLNYCSRTDEEKVTTYSV